MTLQDVIAALENTNLDPEQQLAIIKELNTAEEANEGIETPSMMADPAAPPANDPNAPSSAPAPLAKSEPAKTGVIDAKAFANIIREQFQQAAQKSEDAKKTAPATRVAGYSAPVPANSLTLSTKYHDLSAQDMAWYAFAKRADAQRQQKSDPLPTEFYREMFDKAQKDALGDNRGDISHNPDYAHSIKSLIAVKSNELDNTGVAAAAGNWVPELWSSDLWKRVRVDNMVASQFPTVEMPSATFDLPVESTDPTVSFVPETTDATQLVLTSGNPIPASLVGAGKKQLVAKKLALRVGFSTEQEEDSIIPFIPQLREQAMRSIQNAIDNVLLNGDTATGGSANINNIDGTPAATDKYLVFGGLRLNGLTNVGVNANGQITLQNIRSLRFSMKSSTNVYANRPEELVSFVDVQTYGKMLNIDELLVYMTNGRGSTVNDGGVPTVDGVAVYPSAELSLANTAGKVATATPANNTTGQLVMAAKRGWYVGYRRNIMTSVDYLAWIDSYQLTATLRLAFINKDTVASGVLYNVTVA